MPTLKEILDRQRSEMIEPKVATLISRIGRVELEFQSRLVNINQKLKEGKPLKEKDLDFINRLHQSL